MDNNSNGENGGVGVLGLLGVSFVILKLTNQIDWSWWYVTLPFWGGLVLFVVVVGIVIVCKSIKYATSEIKKEDENKTFQERVNKIDADNKDFINKSNERRKEIRNRFKSK